MSLEWWERVPKKNREAQLAVMSEGKYLGVLRTAALRQEHIDSGPLKQSTLAKELGTKPGNLRDMESGYKRAPLAVCRKYCELMGIPITALKRVGKPSLTWDGDEPSDPQLAEAPKAEQPPARKKPRRKKTEEEKERDEKLRAEKRMIDGAQLAINMGDAKSLKFRNQIEYNLVVVVTQSDKGHITVDIFDEGADTSPSQLLKDGFTGVRLALPQVVTYDFDNKKKVTEASVPTED
jgi:DNA-binding XRE family transcriptional regulator